MAMMLDSPVPGKRWRGGQKAGGKTRVRDIWKMWGRRRTYWTGQSGIMIFITIPGTPDEEKSPRKKNGQYKPP